LRKRPNVATLNTHFQKPQHNKLNMKKLHRSKKASLPLLPLAAVAALGGLHSASAILTADLRAVSITPGAGTIDSTKGVTVNPDAAPGTLVTFEIWAVVTGTDASGTNETLTSVGAFSLLSSPGNVAGADTGVAGNTALSGLALSGPLIRGGFTNALSSPWGGASTASNGTAVDLDADGDLDIGSTSATPVPGFIQANTGAGPQSTGDAGVNFNQLSNGREWRISIATFNIAQVLAGGSTGFNVVFGYGAGSAPNQATRASFVTDGVTRNGADAQLAVAAPVILQVIPEPSVAVTLLGGVATLLGLRRRKH
jgi:hypothetical protein